MADAPDRRTFLKLASGAVGGGIGLVVVAPAMRLGCDPVGEQTVTKPTTPIDVGSLDAFAVGGLPRRVDVRAPIVRDGWVAERDIVLGAAWIRRPTKATVEALSGVCPHLGCAVGFDSAAKRFVCPCHQRAFELDGKNQKQGPDERPMDALPIAVKDGRLHLTWVRFKSGGAAKVPV